MIGYQSSSSFCLALLICVFTYRVLRASWAGLRAFTLVAGYQLLLPVLTSEVISPGVGFSGLLLFVGFTLLMGTAFLAYSVWVESSESGLIWFAVYSVWAWAAVNMHALNVVGATQLAAPFLGDDIVAFPLIVVSRFFSTPDFTSAGDPFSGVCMSGFYVVQGVGDATLRLLSGWAFLLEHGSQLDAALQRAGMEPFVEKAALELFVGFTKFVVLTLDAAGSSLAVDPFTGVAFESRLDCNAPVETCGVEAPKNDLVLTERVFSLLSSRVNPGFAASAADVSAPVFAVDGLPETAIRAGVVDSTAMELPASGRRRFASLFLPELTPAKPALVDHAYISSVLPPVIGQLRFTSENAHTFFEALQPLPDYVCAVVEQPSLAYNSEFAQATSAPMEMPAPSGSGLALPGMPGGALDELSSINRLNIEAAFDSACIVSPRPDSADPAALL